MVELQRYSITDNWTKDHRGVYSNTVILTTSHNYGDELETFCNEDPGVLSWSKEMIATTEDGEELWLYTISYHPLGDRYETKNRMNEVLAQAARAEGYPPYY